MKAFPTVGTLAHAPLSRVLKLWEGLGYYARARNLHRAARLIVRKYGGRLPSDFDALLELPGIGRYTAGAIASIAFDQRKPVLDGNVKRVLARLFAIRDDIRKQTTVNRLWELSESLLRADRVGDFNQALMELGATVCVLRDPLCPKCPLRRSCLAFRQHITAAIPAKSPARRIPHFTVAAGIIRKGDRILIAQRPLNGLLGGLWEFPGGKKDRGESLPDCLKREVREELGIQIEVGRRMQIVKHAYSHFRVTLHFFDCRYVSGKPRAIGCAAFKWLRPRDLRRYAFPAADHPLLRLVSETRK